MKLYPINQWRTVKVEFLDHFQFTGADLPDLRCSLVGQLAGETKDAYVIVVWMAGEEIDSNTESYMILKSAVTKITKLPRGRHGKAKKRKANK